MKIEDEKLILEDKEVFFTMKNREGKTEEHCIETLALAVLLIDDVCFLNERPYSHDHCFQDEPKSDSVKVDGQTTIVYVNCNDLFYWACSDAEDLPREEIGNLYRMHKANSKWGSSKWCCLRRKLRPQVPIVEDMKKDGFWDSELEALPAPEPS